MKTSDLAGGNYSSADLLRATADIDADSRIKQQKAEQEVRLERQRRSWARKLKRSGFTVTRFPEKA